MISAVSNHGAAISAKRIINTAEMAKLGAITQFGPSPVPNDDSNRSKSSAVKPVVPDHRVDPVHAEPRQRRAVRRGPR